MKGVILAITILAFVAVIAGAIIWMRWWPALQRQQSAVLAGLIEEAAREYESENPRVPRTDSAALVQALLGENPQAKAYLKQEIISFLDEQGRLVDAWKRPFRIESGPPDSREDSGPLQLRSAGPNGVFGDSDDITSRYLVEP